MTVADRAVVRSPVVHDRIHVPECAAVREPRHEPGGGPGRVGAFHEFFAHGRRQLDTFSFGKLEYRAEPFDPVDSRHCDRHAARGFEGSRETASAEIAVIGRAKPGCRKAIGNFGVGNFPERLHGRFAVFNLTAGSVEAGCAGIDKMYDAASRGAGERSAGDALHRIGAPISPDIGKNLSGAGEEVAEQHGNAVQVVVLGRDDERLPYAVPVKRGGEHGFEEIPVGEMIGPLALSLEPGCDGVSTERLLAESEFVKNWISNHEVAPDDRHFDNEFPVPHFLFAAKRCRVAVGAFDA